VFDYKCQKQKSIGATTPGIQLLGVQNVRQGAKIAMLNEWQID
jgi:hypothetical protein